MPGCSHRRWHSSIDAIPEDCRGNKVATRSACGWVEGRTHLFCRRWLHRRCAASWTHLRWLGTQKTSACWSDILLASEKTRSMWQSPSRHYISITVYVSLSQYSPAKGRGGVSVYWVPLVSYCGPTEPNSHSSSRVIWLWPGFRPKCHICELSYS